MQIHFVGLARAVTGIGQLAVVDFQLNLLGEPRLLANSGF